MTTFSDFLGNTVAVDQLRASIASGRLPHSLILAGPQGSGKYTLALMLAQALNCEVQPRESAANGVPLAGFCGACNSCVKIAAAQAFSARIEEAIAVSRRYLEDARYPHPAPRQRHGDRTYHGGETEHPQENRAQDR